MAQEIKEKRSSFEEGELLREHSPLQLAYFGDAVFELFIRQLVLLKVSGHVDKLNRKTKQLSGAVTQAKIADLLGTEEFLTEEERVVLRRGRNAKSASVPKSCTPAEYRKATGLEALMGWLYLRDRKERILQIILFGIERIYGDSFFSAEE